RVVRDDVYEPDGERLLGPDAPAGREELRGPRAPDEAREARGPAEARQDATPRARMCKRRARRRVPDVAREREIEPAAHAVAVDRRDAALRRALDAVEHALAVRGEGERRAWRERGDLAKVRAGGKRVAARAPHHDRRDVARDCERLEGGAERLE